MLRAAAELTRDLNTPRTAIYWADLLASVAIGYLALAGAITLAGGWAVAAGVVAVLALYRALSFIHELTHIKRSEEHTSELQSLMRISYAVFCLKQKKKTTQK